MVRKIMVMLIVLSLSTLVGFADEKKGKMDAEAHVAKLQAALNLDADQTAQVKTVFTDILKRLQPIRTIMRAAHEQLKEMRSANPTDAEAIEAKRGELEAIRAEKRSLLAERDRAMEQILTPEQFVKYQEIAAAHSKKRMGSGHPKKGEGHKNN